MNSEINEMMKEKREIEREIKERLNEFCAKCKVINIDIELANCRGFGCANVHIGDVAVRDGINRNAEDDTIMNEPLKLEVGMIIEVDSERKAQLNYINYFTGIVCGIEIQSKQRFTTTVNHITRIYAIEPIEMTVAEISKKLGYPVKIVE